MYKFLTTAVCWLVSMSLSAQVITQAEYFFNTDPGVGNGTPIAVVPGDTVLPSFTFPTAGLDVGYHYLWVRTRDGQGQWSIYLDHLFYIYDTEFTDETSVQTPIVAAEYFVNTDPGVGNGTPIAVTPGDTVLANFTMSTAGLDVGYHYLWVRTQDANGQWSIYHDDFFYVFDTEYTDETVEQTPIVGAEYFIDTDPGVGNGTALNITPGDTVLHSFTLDVGTLPLGTYNLYIRTVDANGQWSLHSSREFEVSDIVLSTVSGTITYDNNASTPMSNVTVELLDAQNAVVATTTTDASGTYTFNDVADGAYTVRPSTTKAWGGVSSIDITLYRRHIGNVPGFILQGIRLGSGDVNVSTTLTSIDLTIIKRRIGAQISSFASGDWLFEDGSITVSGGNVSRDIKAICYGDANGSYTPPQ